MENSTIFTKTLCVQEGSSVVYLLSVLNTLLFLISWVCNCHTFHTGLETSVTSLEPQLGELTKLLLWED